MVLAGGYWRVCTGGWVLVGGYWLSKQSVSGWWPVSYLSSHLKAVQNSPAGALMRSRANASIALACNAEGMLAADLEARRLVRRLSAQAAVDAARAAAEQVAQETAFLLGGWDSAAQQQAVNAEAAAAAEEDEEDEEDEEEREAGEEREDEEEAYASQPASPCANSQLVSARGGDGGDGSGGGGGHGINLACSTSAHLIGTGGSAGVTAVTPEEARAERRHARRRATAERVRAETEAFIAAELAASHKAAAAGARGEGGYDSDDEGSMARVEHGWYAPEPEAAAEHQHLGHLGFDSAVEEDDRGLEVSGVARGGMGPGGRSGAIEHEHRQNEGDRKSACRERVSY